MNIAIAAIGARTAVGYNAVQSAVAVRAGIANFNAVAHLIDARGDPMVVASAPGMPASPDPRARLLALTQAALDDLVSHLPVTVEVPPLPMVLALPGARPGLPPGCLGALPRTIMVGGPSALGIAHYELIFAGGTGALEAIARGIVFLHEGRAPPILVGAADSWLHVATLDWLDATRRLHSSSAPWGFVPGEAAGACLLGALETLARLGLPNLGVIHAVAVTDEPHPFGGDVPCIGAGLTAALQAVLRDLPSQVGPVDGLYCDLNGERHRTDETGFALVRVREYLRDPTSLTTPADCWGDLGTASGMLLIALQIAAARRGYARSRHALFWCSSDGPRRAALLLESPGAPTSPPK